MMWPLNSKARQIWENVLDVINDDDVFIIHKEIIIHNEKKWERLRKCLEVNILNIFRKDSQAYISMSFVYRDIKFSTWKEIGGNK